MGPSSPSPDLIRDVLNLPSTPCTLKLMICFPRLRTLRRNPRRLWLMPPVLLMNLELNKSSGQQEKAKRSLESQIAELELRLTEANDIASKSGRAAMAKLESRIRELEIELGGSQSKTSDTFKGFQKAERRIMSSNSNWMKTTRTKTACLNWPENSNKRSRPTRS